MMLGIVWNGTDGSVWDLRGGPVRASTKGLKGLGMPDLSDQTRKTAMRDGQTLTGWRIEPREVWLPLQFKAEAAIDVEGLQRDFWRSMALGQTGTLVVTDASGATRSLGLRFQDDGGMSYQLDPYALSAPFGLTMVADSPWWEGPPVTFSYALATGALLDFFGDGAGATPFYISPSEGGAASTLDNPGDQPAWVEWTVAGQAAGVRLGVDGHFVGGPIAVGTSGLLTIETDPLRQLAWLDGVKVTRQLTEIDFAPIPTGASVPISVSIVGAGVVTATIKPRYARAF